VKVERFISLELLCLINLTKNFRLRFVCFFNSYDA